MTKTHRIARPLCLAILGAMALPLSGCWPVPGIDDLPGASSESGDSQDPDDPSDEGEELPKLEERRSELPRNKNPSITQEQRAKLRDGNLDLGFSLLRSGIVKDHENLAISATSIRAAFGMVHAMAAKATQLSISEVLGLLQDPDDTQAGLNYLDLELMSRNLAKTPTLDPVILSSANQVFVRQDIEPGDDYLDLLATHYDAGVYMTDFRGEPELSRKQINRWVSERTNDRIPELCPKNSIDPLTQWVLVNALYLKAPWVNKLGQPSPGEFTRLDGSKVQVEMMWQPEISTQYGTQPDFQWAQMPLRGEDLSVTVILPHEGKHEDVQKSLNSSSYQRMLAEGKKGNVWVRLPKFTIDTGTLDFTNLFKQRMPDAFRNKFPGFSPDRLLAPITFVYHSVFLAADEKGVEAAAATAVGGKESGSEIDKVLKLNRPFFFTIHDKGTGLALFTGRVMDPSR